MKSTCLLVLFISTLCISVIAADQPKSKTNGDEAELKLSLSTQAINKLVAFLGDMVDNINQGAVVKIPLDVDVKGKWNLYTIQLNTLKLANHTVNWNKDAIAINALDANTFQIQIKGVSLNFTGFEDITFLKFIQIKNNFTLTLTDLTFLTTISLTPSTDPNSIGFSAKLSSTSLTLDSLYINLEDQKIYNYMLKPFTWILKKLLNPIIKIAVYPINSMINKFCSKPLSPQFKIGKYTYQFDLNFPNGVTQKDADLRIPINMKKITNLNSTDVANVTQITDIPEQYFTNHTKRYDLQLLLGTGIVNQALWTASDSKLLSLTLNSGSALMKNIPLQLNLQGVQLLLPGIYNEYAIRRKMPPTTGIYIQGYVPQQNPDIRLVGGRLIGTLNASAKFFVELNPDEYPVADINKCECDEAADIQLTLYFAADVYTPGKFKVGANVSNLQVISATKTSGPIDFDGEKFATSATALIYNLVGIINNQLSKGMDIPYVSQASFLQDITVIFEQGYVLVDVGIDPSN